MKRPSDRLLSMVFRASFVGCAAFVTALPFIMTDNASKDDLFVPLMCVGVASGLTALLTYPFHLLHKEKLGEGYVSRNGGPT